MSKSLFLIVSLVLFVAGLFIIFSSVTWGSETANTYLRAQGGSMDTNQFIAVLQGYINAYRWIGGILCLLSGLGFIKLVEFR